MSYKRAEHVLPSEIVELIQDYIDGESIYIPRKDNDRREWGEKTKISNELDRRNQQIYDNYRDDGYNTHELAQKYFLSKKSIQRIILKMKNIT